MSIDLYPHQIFTLDFHQLLSEASRQEDLHPANQGEKNIAAALFDFFSTEIAPQIAQNGWVFEGARTFAHTYAAQYFQTLRLVGEQTVRYQRYLHEDNDEVTRVLASLAVEGKAPHAGKIDLAKGSDFVDLVLLDRLADDEKGRIMALRQKVMRHEELQLGLTLRSIRDMYEIGLPRVLFVVRRALKTVMGLAPSSSDERLLQPSDYTDWVASNTDPDHPIYDLLVGDELGTFYKVARNVASHHQGLRWLPDHNVVLLEDRNYTLEVPVHTFQQRYRYLLYLCDYGTRAILASFSARERGALSLSVCREYEATFPAQTPDLAKRTIKPYPA